MTRKPEVMTLHCYYTNAPVAYDGFGTITLAPADSSGRFDNSGTELRKVGILPVMQEWQLSRYSSGLFQAYTHEELEALNDSA